MLEMGAQTVELLAYVGAFGEQDDFLRQALRRDGAAALDLCYVAAGRADGFWERPLQPWDMAAGALLVREAGGRVTSFRGGPPDIYSAEIVATNGAIHDDLLAAIAAAE